MAERFLSIDGGNTRLKATLFTPQADAEVFVFAPGDAEGLLSLIERKGVESAAMAGVGHIDGRLVESLRMVLDERFMLITPGIELPISVNYDDPRHLGLDRKATAVAAAREYPGFRCIVIDAGTALTCDIVTPDGFMAGSISPGLSMRFRALHEFTAALPLVDSDGDLSSAQSFASSTEGAIRAGAVRGFVDEVAGAINRAAASYAITTAIITGGNSNLIMESLERGDNIDLNVTRIIHDPHLLAKGIRVIYRHNENEI